MSCHGARSEDGLRGEGRGFGYSRAIASRLEHRHSGMDRRKLCVPYENKDSTATLRLVLTNRVRYVLLYGLECICLEVGIDKHKMTSVEF